MIRRFPPPSFLYFAATILNRGLNFLLLPILTRFLSPGGLQDVWSLVRLPSSSDLSRRFRWNMRSMCFISSSSRLSIGGFSAHSRCLDAGALASCRCRLGARFEFWPVPFSAGALASIPRDCGMDRLFQRLSVDFAHASRERSNGR